MATNDTPRTDEAAFWAVDHSRDNGREREVVLVKFARQLERELNAANEDLIRLYAFTQRLQEMTANAEAKLSNVLYDKDYEGGVQYWIRKHDELALILARLQAAEAGHQAVRDAAAS